MTPEPLVQRCGCPLEALESQEVSLGYKRTEAGVIPWDWEAKRLGDVSTMGSGGTPDSSVPAYYGGGIPWVSISDMTHFDRVIMQTERSLTAAGLEHSAAQMFPTGTVLYAMYASIGECSLAGVPLCTSQAILGIRPDLSLDNEFLCYWLASQKESIRSRGQQGTQANLNKQIVQDLVLPVPSMREQRAIAEALSDVDGLLGALKALIAKKRAIQTAVMQQLLTGKTRLPGFTGDWAMASVGDVADVCSGATPSTGVAAFWDGTIPWCTPTDITSAPSKYLLGTDRTITEQGLASCAATLLPAGALLLCSRATIGVVKIAAMPVCTNQGFKSLVCHSGVSNEFMYYTLLTLKSQMLALAIGSTFLELGKRDLSSIELLMPQLDEQLAIATVLSDMDHEISLLAQRRDKTRAIKRGMMQQLLTGRTRLVEPMETEATG